MIVLDMQARTHMSLDPKLALVVEDDFLQRQLLTDVLRQRDFDVVECATAEAGELLLGRVGLELALLVTDVNLGSGKTGLELAAFARSQLPVLSIIVISGEVGLDIPPDMSFLAKPWSEEVLRSMV
jgi:DNA-binding response OmpR family regulator